jgi:hypothetical protein
MTMIRIKSKRHNFRRCGIAHPADAVEYPDTRFTEIELARLQAEPMLIVEVIPENPAAPPAETAKKIPGENPGKAAESDKKLVKPGKKGKK